MDGEGSKQSHGDGEIGRHIIFKCFPAAAARSPWVGTELAACLTHRPCPVRGASSRRLRRRIDGWWQPANGPTTPGWSEGPPRTATMSSRASAEGRGEKLFGIREANATATWGCFRVWIILLWLVDPDRESGHNRLGRMTGSPCRSIFFSPPGPGRCRWPGCST